MTEESSPADGINDAAKTADVIYVNSPTVRRAAFGIAIALPLVPAFDFAIAVGLVLVVMAWGSASVALHSRHRGLAPSLLTAHIGVGIIAAGTVLRTIEARAAGEQIAILSWASILVGLGFALTSFALFQAVLARGAIAHAGDLLDAVAAAAVLSGFGVILAWPYLAGSAPIAERGIFGSMLVVEAVFLALLLLLAFGPGVRSPGTLWFGLAGFLVVGADLIGLVGFALDASWRDEPLRLLATPFVFYAMATSHETYCASVSSAPRPERYRWGIYAISSVSVLGAAAATADGEWLLILGVVLACVIGRLTLAGTTAGRLTNIVATHAQLERSLSCADSVEAAFDAGERACRLLIPHGASVVYVQDLIAGLVPATLNSIIIAEGETIAIVVEETSSIPSHIRHALGQVANVVDFAIGSIEARAQRAELDELAAATEAKLLAEKAWHEISVDPHDVAVRVVSDTVAKTTPNAREKFGFDPVGRDLASLPVLRNSSVDGEAFADPTQPGRWVKVSKHLEADKSSVYTIRDVTAEMVDAHTDPVTGLHNQADFDSSVAITSTSVLVFYFHDVDLEADSAGQAAADMLMKALGDRVSLAFRDGNDRIWRGEGPSLIVLSDVGQVNEWVEERRQSLCAPISIDGRTISPTVTAGAAVIEGETVSGLAARVRAETALNHAREKKRNTTMWYSDQLFAEVSRQWQIETSLELALADPVAGGFDVHYQPIVSTNESADVCAAEALARWCHPELGNISPSEFIPVAEARGLVGAIDTYVLNRVIDDLPLFHDFDVEFKVHVNLSPVVALAAKLQEVGQTVRKRIPESASAIVVEITETGLGSQEMGPVVESCEMLRALGVGLSLDDCGTGDSSFNRIGSLPLTEVKLARSFAVSDDPIMVGNFVRSVHQLGLVCVAENVESEHQKTLVTDAGADFIQGYLYAKPGGLQDTLNWIANWTNQSVEASQG